MLQVFSAKYTHTLRWEEEGHPQVICPEQWAASAPEGIADPKIYFKKMHCKANPPPKPSGIRIPLNCIAASNIAMVTSESAKTYIIKKDLQQNNSYWFV